MAWLESHQTLERDTKLFLLRKALGWDKNQAVGFLHRFWWLVLEQAPNGDVSGLAAEMMAETLGMKADVVSQALELMASKEIGLLDRTTDGKLLVHEWPKYTGRYLRDSLWKRSPEKWLQMITMYGSCIVLADSQLTSPKQSPTEGAGCPILSAVPNQTRPNYSSSPTGAGDARPASLKSGKNPANTYSVEFERFWAAFPRKVGKGAAYARWKSRRPPLEDVLKAIAIQRQCAQWQDITLIPHPDTWLNQKRWEDDPAAYHAQKAPPPLQENFALAESQALKAAGGRHVE